MEKFRKLHSTRDPLLMANVWDVESAVLAQKMGFKALGTSSAAIATMLGYKDGEDMEFDTLKFIVKRILSNIKIPLSVDLEAGYSSEGHQVAKNIKSLVEMGVVGVNIEDSFVLDGKRSMLPMHHFVELLEAIKDHLRTDNVEVFINARTDGFITGHKEALSESLSRMSKYEAAGADGIFVPCVTNEDDIRQLVEHTSLPVNVMCMPELPHFETLSRLGVKRISMGNFLHAQLSNSIENMLKNVIEEQSFKSLFIQ